MRRCAFVTGIIGVLATAPLPAQRVLTSLDLSGTGLWYADSLRAAGSALSPAIRVDWPRATIAAFGAVSRVGDGIGVQGSLAPSLFTPSIGPLSGELTASIAGSTHPGDARTGQGLAIARAYLTGRRTGLWAGIAAGATWDGAFRRNIRQTEAGAWIRSHGVLSLLTVMPVTVADSIRYTDFQAAARFPTPNVELGISAGTRTGFAGAAIGGTSRVWGSVSTTVWLSPSLAIVGGVGSYPVDLTQGYPGGRYVTLALRIASRNTRHVQSIEDGALDRARPSRREVTEHSVLNDFAVRATGARRELRLRAPSAHTLEINGDFTGWQPVPFSRSRDGTWTVAFELPPGTYQFNVRVDGGPWTVPPGVLVVRDEFGGTAGILEIE